MTFLAFVVCLTQPASADPKEDACLAECDSLSDADAIAACRGAAQAAKDDGGCFNGKWTDRQCCKTVAQDLSRQLKRAKNECSALGADQETRCMELYSKECLAKAKGKSLSVDGSDLYACLNARAMATIRGAGLGDACQEVPERDRALCKDHLQSECAKERDSKGCVEKAKKNLDRMAQAWPLCDLALDRSNCEAAYRGCQESYRSEKFVLKMPVSECFENIAGAYGKQVLELNKAFVDDDKYDGKPTHLGRRCESVAKGAELAAAEKEKFQSLCDLKIKELAAKAEVDGAARELKHVLGKVEDYQERLEKRAVLGLSVAEIKNHGENCHALVKTLQEGRKLADTDAVTMNHAFKDKELPLAGARQLCQWCLDNLEPYSKAIKEERAKDAAKTIAAFCGRNDCKGKAQKTTLDALIKGAGIQVGASTLDGTPSAVRKKNGNVHWTWTWGRGSDPIMCSCDHIVFDGGGNKIVKKFTERCVCADWR